MDFKINSRVHLAGVKYNTREEIKNLLTLDNPKYQEAVKMGRWTGTIPEKLTFYYEFWDTLTAPRGAARQIYQICSSHGEEINIIDERRTLDPVDFQFMGELRPLQQRAVEDTLKKDFGVLEAGTGAGKTVMALYLISQRKQPALIIVHTTELLNQWIDRVEQFLNIPKPEIGIIGAGKFQIGEKITVAMVQSLYKIVDQVSPFIGYLIVDECHRAPSRTFTEAVDAFDCKYTTGLTATPYRRDGLTKVLNWTLGRIIGRIEKKDLLDAGSLCPANVSFIETDFRTGLNTSEDYSKVLSELTEDPQRNKLICKTIAENNGHGISLILSDRKVHCEAIRGGLENLNIQSEVLTGSTTPKERERIISDLNNDRCRYLVATGQLIGEGFDLPGISSVFLSTPLKFSGRLIQYIGRALRPAPGKDTAFIFDFVDVLDPVFKASARSRQETYKSQGIAPHGCSLCQ